MNYFNELEKANEEILRLKNYASIILADEESITLKSEEYLRESSMYGDFYLPDRLSTPVRQQIKKDILELEKQINKLKAYRNEIIDKIIKLTSISVSDLLSILENFKMYFKVERIGARSLIIPQDVCIIKNGSQNVIEESKLISKLAAFNTIKADDGKIVPKDVEQSVPLYIRSTSNGISINNHILELASGIEVNELEGLKLYQRSKDGVEFNRDLLNILPYDVLAFIDYFVAKRFETPVITIMAAYNEYKQEQTSVKGLSYDDPAMKDSYRHR